MYNGHNGIFMIELRHFNIMNTIIHNNGFTTFEDEYSLKLGYLFNPKTQILVASCTEIIINNS